MSIFRLRTKRPRKNITVLKYLTRTHVGGSKIVLWCSSSLHYSEFREVTEKQVPAWTKKGLSGILALPITRNTEAESGYSAIRDATEATSHRLECMVRWLPRVLQPQDLLGSNQEGPGLKKLPQSPLKPIRPHQILSGGHAYSSQSMPVNVSWDPKAQGSAGMDTPASSVGTQHIHPKPLPQAGDALSTVQGIGTALLLLLRGLAVHPVCLKRQRYLLAKVHREIMFSKKKNSLPNNQDEGKYPMGESEQTFM